MTLTSALIITTLFTLAATSIGIAYCDLKSKEDDEEE